MKGDLHKALLGREMTRKEFLQFVGASLVILLGLPNFLKLLQRTAKPDQGIKTNQAAHGFGSRKFGQ